MQALTLWNERPVWNVAGLVLDASLKSFLLLALTWAVSLCWRRASAATRHLLWFGAVVGSLCFPLVSRFVPGWQQPLWTVGSRFDSGNQIAVVVSLAPKPVQATTAQPVGAVKPGTISAVEGASADNSLFQTTVSRYWVRAALVIWAGGLLLVGILAGRDRVRLSLLRRRAKVPAPREWSSQLESLCRELGVGRRVRLLQSSEGVMPVTWGSWRPVILIPAGAESWPNERRRVVLLHELAHVKRWDCLSQLLAQAACAFYWFNPLAWVAARQMCIERERACDDLVLESGFKPSDYAAHLLEIAGSFQTRARRAGIAMAHASQLKNRIASIVQVSRGRRPGRVAAMAVWLVFGGLVLAIGANQPSLPVATPGGAPALLDNQLAALKAFSIAKLKQSQSLAAGAGEQISPEYRRFFEAAVSGDAQTVTNMYADFKRRHPQYAGGTSRVDEHLSTAYWSPVLEICLAYDQVVQCDPKYTELLAKGIINSIPPGSVYFGGTDPGRGVPTAFAKSQIEGEPFFILTQNALADGTYLQYLRETYGDKIYTPSQADSQRCFGEYTADARRRLEHDRQFPAEPKQVRPGENIKLEGDKVLVSGQVAVMSINGLLTKLIFDLNPTREFFIEESFPLDWMYPYLTPHGLILKIEREPMARLSPASIAQDRSYWQTLVNRLVGDWLKPETPVNEVARFVDRVYAQHDLSGFTGDPSFVRNDYAKRLFSKLRSSIAGIYAWRAAHPADQAEAARLATEADFAFRQAFALCPYSPEAVFRYATFLAQQNRIDDALRLATASLRINPGTAGLQDLVRHLSETSK